MSRENVEVVRRAYDAFNSRDVDALVALAAEDCEWRPFRAQLEGTAYRGHEGIRKFVRDMDDDWGAYRIDPLDFHDRGEQVVVIGRVTALREGSGAQIDAVAGFVFELHDRLIARITSYSDPAAALQAAGLSD